MRKVTFPKFFSKGAFRFNELKTNEPREIGLLCLSPHNLSNKLQFNSLSSHNDIWSYKWQPINIAYSFETDGTILLFENICYGVLSS